MQYQFKQGFKWGGASSGPQSEGTQPEDGKMPSVWDKWFSENPEKFFDGIGPDRTSNFYGNYKGIISAMKEVGIQSYRTSIQWSRLLKDCDGTLNPEGVEFYNCVINE
ncbi:MAG: family 1 glycosylhydrolase, partial [Hungatella sp.]